MIPIVAAVVILSWLFSPGTALGIFILIAGILVLVSL